jgi:hypothetical protein
MAYSQSGSLSQSFSRTQTVSHDNQVENGRVEFTSACTYKTSGPKKFESIESPYGPAQFPTFGSQYGMSASKGVEPIKPPYGKAQVPLFGP